jgi:hypothetical protein
MAGGSIRGVVGLIKWRYYHAAAINGYTVTRGQTGRWSLRATVVTADRFKMAQKPLLFVAPHAKGEWRWPIVDLEIRDGVVTAQLGMPEEVSHGGESVRAGGHQALIPLPR